MAEPKPAEATRPDGAQQEDRAEDARKLVALSERESEPTPASPTPDPEPERKGVSRGLFAFVVVLLALALTGLYAQTRRAAAQAERIAVLGNQVEGLEVQLSAAETQLANYDMQLSLVQDSVTDMYEKMGALLELVTTSPYDVDPDSPGPR